MDFCDSVLLNFWVSQEHVIYNAAVKNSVECDYSGDWNLDIDGSRKKRDFRKPGSVSVCGRNTGKRGESSLSGLLLWSLESVDSAQNFTPRRQFVAE
jgi:hypothetical protein